MLMLRKVGKVLLGAMGGAWIVGMVLGQLLGVHGTTLRVVALGAAALGGIGMLDEAKAVQPMPAQERHDTLVGWMVLLGGVAALACTWLLWPWGLLAAVAPLAITAVVVRRVA